MISPDSGRKGAVKLALMISILLGFVLASAYVLLNYSQVAFAEVQNRSSNNITLDQESGYNNFASFNNTERFSQRGINVSVYIINISGCNGVCIQWVTFYYSNGTSSFAAYNLTNDTTRSNQTHQYYYNNTPIQFATQFNRTVGNGAYRNATISWFNKTSGTTGAQEWMNNSVTHTPINFTVNELINNITNSTYVITVDEPGTNGTNYTTQRPFDINITANITFTVARFLQGNNTGTLVTMTGFNSSQSAHNTTPVVFVDSQFNATQNITFLIEDGFGNRTWLNNSPSHTPLVFRTDSNNPVVGPVSVQIMNVTIQPDYPTMFNVTVLNTSVTINNGTFTSLELSFPANKALRILNISNETLNVTSGNWTLDANGTHFNTTFVGYAFANTTYNVTFIRLSLAADTLHYPGNYLNVTFFAADNNTMNASVRLWDARNNSWMLFPATRMSGAIENATFAVNISSNSTLVNSTLSWPDGLFRVAGRADDFRGWTNAGYSPNMTFIKQDWYSTKPNIVTWYQTNTMAFLMTQTPNITRMSTYDNRWGFKNFTTCVNGIAANCDTNVQQSLNTTFVTVPVNMTSFRMWNAGGSLRNTNQTTESGGWNLVGVRTIIHNLNETFNRSATFTNSTTGEVPAVQAGNTAQLNVTHFSVFNGTQGRFCTERRNFTQTACSPLFNATDLVAPEGYGLWFLSQINMSTNITASGEFRQ